MVEGRATNHRKLSSIMSWQKEAWDGDQSTDREVFNHLRIGGHLIFSFLKLCQLSYCKIQNNTKVNQARGLYSRALALKIKFELFSQEAYDAQNSREGSGS